MRTSKLFSVNRGFAAILIVGLILAASTLAGAFYLQQSQPTPQSSPTPDETVYPDEGTSNWKTYTNSKRFYTFKYPEQFLLRETQASKTFEEVILEKDAQYLEGGLGGGNILNSGLVISFTVFPKKDISETELRDEHGSDIKTELYLIDNREAVAVIQPQNQYRGRQIYLKEGSIVIGFYCNYGPLTTNKDREICSQEFYQILSTFKFIDEDPLVCIQIITPAVNRTTGERKEFPTPCDVPEGWQKVE